MAKQILILVGIPNFNYANEQSAVLSFLNTLKKAFELEGHSVEFAENPKENPTPNLNPTTESQNKAKGFVKKVLKKWTWLYQTLAYRGYFKQQNQLFTKLVNGKKFDHIVEFHTVGSTIGKNLAEKWGASFAVVFDSPVDEQFVEMYKTKTAYWARIVNSEKETLQAANKIMAYSLACQAYIQKKYNLKADISILPCVIHKPSTINKANDTVFSILFIGSFLVWHKVELLVEVFVEFQKTYPASKLQLIGFGEEWENVKNKVAELGAEKSVEMPGFVSEDELLQYKQNCTIGIMPGSNWYGSPLKLFEYAQSKIPFIAPTTKTVSAIFKNETHCLFIDPESEKKSLLIMLTFLYENPLKRREMASRAHEYVKNNYEDSAYANKLVQALLN